MAYDDFLNALRTATPESKERLDRDPDLRKAIDHVRSTILGTPKPTPKSISTHNASLARPSVHSGRYLGAVSDVHFVHMVRRKILEHSSSDRVDDAMETYDQEELIPEPSVKDTILNLPSPETAEKYLNVYFATIHIAYPFIPKSTFLQTYQKLRRATGTEEIGLSWLALLCELFSMPLFMADLSDIILAIGSYYTSFPNAVVDDGSTHVEYFQRALALISPGIFERSVTHISFLLAQCFYLLTTCKVDQ